jgi:hypothetical protein
MAKVNKISMAAYARHRGVSSAAITKAVHEGRITLDENRKIDPVAADAQWTANTRVRANQSAPQTQPKATAADGDAPIVGEVGYWDSRSKREAAEADMADLKLKEMQGNLIQVSAVRSVLATAFSTTRTRLMQIPARLASTLCVETDAAKVHQILTDELHAALEQIDTVAAKLGGAAEDTCA